MRGLTLSLTHPVSSSYRDLQARLPSVYGVNTIGGNVKLEAFGIGIGHGLSPGVVEPGVCQGDHHGQGGQEGGGGQGQAQQVPGQATCCSFILARNTNTFFTLFGLQNFAIKTDLAGAQLPN